MPNCITLYTSTNSGILITSDRWQLNTKERTKRGLFTLQATRDEFLVGEGRKLFHLRGGVHVL